MKNSDQDLIARIGRQVRRFQRLCRYLTKPEIARCVITNDVREYLNAIVENEDGYNFAFHVEYDLSIYIHAFCGDTIIKRVYPMIEALEEGNVMNEEIKNRLTEKNRFTRLDRENDFNRAMRGV